MDYIFQVEKDERSPADIAYVKSEIDVVKRMSYEREMQLEMILAQLWHVCLQMFSSSRHRGLEGPPIIGDKPRWQSEQISRKI